ncbi:hypothetical protein [Labrenzia sp. VG12]|uniref:hypothetical protein n=1 Tax=Labrenzia sp. VG12 TaxID=2021862 RepID=UPI0012FDE51A|nr:hypothetical protein [Labrenzia sp. VG12]
MNTCLKPSLQRGAAVLVSLLLPSLAGAADLAYDPAPVTEPVNQRIDKTWEFLVAPYFVAANITGTSQVGRLPNTDIDIGTDDILENLRFGGMIRTELIYQQKVGAMLDVAYMNLGSATDTPRGGGRIRVGVSQLILEGMGFYRAYATPQTSIDIYAGGRYWDIDLDLNATGTFAGNFTISRGDNWIDPVIGVRAFHMINDKWSVNARGDIGGFGAASDFTWNVQAGAGYHFNKTWSAHLQYKALGVDYDNGKSGTASFAYDTITHGPLLGIAARF